MHGARRSYPTGCSTQARGRSAIVSDEYAVKGLTGILEGLPIGPYSSRSSSSAIDALAAIHRLRRALARSMRQLFLPTLIRASSGGDMGLSRGQLG